MCAIDFQKKTIYILIFNCSLVGFPFGWLMQSHQFGTKFMDEQFWWRKMTLWLRWIDHILVIIALFLLYIHSIQQRIGWATLKLVTIYGQWWLAAMVTSLWIAVILMETEYIQFWFLICAFGNHFHIHWISHPPWHSWYCRYRCHCSMFCRSKRFSMFCRSKRFYACGEESNR